MTRVNMPEWVWAFHGHKCTCMATGYRMGLVAMRELGAEPEKEQRMFAFSEIGDGYPSSCLNDGIQASTGCTYGKLLLEKLDYGKYAFVLYKPGKGAIRVSTRPEFLDQIARHEFSRLRKSGMELSKIPPELADEVVGFILSTSEADIFKIERLPNFSFERPARNSERVRCSRCGEYVFKRYAHVADGKSLCVSCSGHDELNPDVTKGRLQESESRR